MATYTELRDLFSNDAMKNKLDIATIIAANNLLDGAPTAGEQSWAATVFSNPRNESIKAWMAVVATNNASSIAQITSASDSTIQTAVDNVVGALVVAHGA